MANATRTRVTSGLARRLAPKTSQISELMVTAMLREVPRYAAAPSLYGQAVLQRCRLAVRIFVRIVESGEPPAVRDINVVRRIGRTVAIAGEPLEPLLHALRIGARVGWEETLRESRRAPALEPEQMLPLAGRVFEYIDQLSSSMAEAYSAEVQEGVRRQAMSETRLFEALTSGQPPTDGLTAFTLEPPRVALALASKADAAAVSAVLGRLRTRLTHGVLGQRQGLPVWLLAREPSPSLLQDCSAGTAVVYGMSAATDEVSLSRAVDEAAISATIGLEHGGGAALYPYTRVYPEAALRSDPAALSRFQAASLGRLREHPEILETLRLYLLAGRSVGATARQVHKHRQTVVYRLRRAGELLGCDLSDPEEVFRLEAAVRTLGHPAAPSGPGAG
ncbi:MAG TPA: helix-turn-helix domain-containing protein [Candidatus Dormibacteraeota bacterium]|nr:helix-turn-helix domain-containing protein [Candidatus Dormibacteraeota bacterium]